jgi:hypothetical protein
LVTLLWKSLLPQRLTIPHDAHPLPRFNESYKTDLFLNLTSKPAEPSANAHNEQASLAFEDPEGHRHPFDTKGIGTNTCDDDRFADSARMDPERHKNLIRFYSLLDGLEGEIGGARRLADCSGRMPWPARGVYFFREQGEIRSDSGSGPRIVRVGTHALKGTSGTKLWTRLSQHRGQSNGGGNHRGSIFRQIVGAALIQRDKLSFPTWGVGNTARAQVRGDEIALERKVSEVIGKMSFLWLPIGDEPGPNSQRGYIERNVIALLSNYEKEPLDPASENWLGHYSDRERVRKSGLWNQNHVDEAYDLRLLEALDHLVSAARHAA